MVRRLLVAAFGGTLACGCLLANPPDYDEVGAAPTRIVKTFPADRDHEEIDLSAPGIQGVLQSFGAEVEDEDLEQRVVYRWFLDYDSTAVDAPFPCGLLDDTEPALPETGSKTRTVAPPFPWWVNLLEAGRCHRLTLVVTDGAFVPDGCAAVDEDAHRASNDWWLLVYSASKTLLEVPGADCRTKEGALVR